MPRAGAPRVFFDFSLTGRALQSELCAPPPSSRARAYLYIISSSAVCELCAAPSSRRGVLNDIYFMSRALCSLSYMYAARALFARAKRCSLSYTYVISSETRNNKLARKVCQPRGFRFGRSRAVVLQLAAIHTRALHLQPRAHYPYGGPWPCAQLSLGIDSVLRILY